MKRDDIIQKNEEEYLNDYNDLAKDKDDIIKDKDDIIKKNDDIYQENMIKMEEHLEKTVEDQERMYVELLDKERQKIKEELEAQYKDKNKDHNNGPYGPNG